MLWAATTNSAPTLYWTLYYILSTKYSTTNNIYNLVREEADIVYNNRKFATKASKSTNEEDISGCGSDTNSSGEDVQTSMYMEVDKDSDGNAVGLVRIS